MEYTWEGVMLGLDVEADSTAKQKREKAILDIRESEQKAMSGWGLGLSLLGGLLFGPVGFFTGKQLGKYGADLAYDWESMEIDEGKFNKQAVRDYNEVMDKIAKDQTGGQILSTLTDLATFYVQSGGLTAEPGEWDPTTFGSGGVEGGEWTAMGKSPKPSIGDAYLAPEGHVIDGIPVAAGTELTPITFTGRDVPGLWDRDTGLFRNIANVGTNLGTTYTQGQTMDYVYQQWLQQRESDQGDKEGK